VPDDRKQRCRIGVVGGGLIAQLAHLPVLGALPRHFRLVALSEPSERVRAALARRYGLATHASHAEMLAAGGLDAVLICSPNETHAATAADAIAAGLHVLVEKPLALVPADARAVASAARRAGVVAQVGYMKRYAPAFAALIGALPSNRRLLRVDSMTVDPGIGHRFRPRDFVDAADVDAETRESARASLLEQAARAAGAATLADARAYSEAFAGALIHDVNLVRAVLRTLELAPGAVLDAVAGPHASLAGCLVDLGDGARWSATWMLAPQARAFTETIVFAFEDRPRTLTFEAPYSDVHATYAAQFRRFHAAIAERAPNAAPAEDGAEDVALVARACGRALSRAEVAAA
jgi:predicted dehydrogenase